MSLASLLLEPCLPSACAFARSCLRITPPRIPRALLHERVRCDVGACAPPSPDTPLGFSRSSQSSRATCVHTCCASAACRRPLDRSPLGPRRCTKASPVLVHVCVHPCHTPRPEAGPDSSYPSQPTKVTTVFTSTSTEVEACGSDAFRPKEEAARGRCLPGCKHPCRPRMRSSIHQPVSLPGLLPRPAEARHAVAEVRVPKPSRCPCPRACVPRGYAPEGAAVARGDPEGCAVGTVPPVPGFPEERTPEGLVNRSQSVSTSKNVARLVMSVGPTDGANPVRSLTSRSSCKQARTCDSPGILWRAGTRRRDDRHAGRKESPREHRASSSLTRWRSNGLVHGARPWGRGASQRKSAALATARWRTDGMPETSRGQGSR
jgi:hypothetical protein